MSNNKCVYYKEKEQKSIDGGITWVDTGNFRKGALITTQASQCGSFVTEYRWTKADYVCDNANKYKGYKQQVSHDNGGTWVDTGVVDIGELISSNSKDCGYDEQWFVMTGDKDFICDGAAKYKKKELKYTRDSGTTWNSFDPPKYEKGDLIEENSIDCASMKVTYTDNSEKTFYNLASIEKDTDTNKENAKKVEIYDDVTGIGEEAFSGCTSLTSITIPNSVKTIGYMAFRNCESLTGITIPDSVTSIGDGTFLYCIQLTSVTIPNSVKTIGGYTFGDCHGLTSVTISNSVTSIGEWAFRYCYGLTSITIPNSVKTIDYMAFRNCESLTGITIPDSVTSIGYGAFWNCESLTSITIPNSVKTIGGYTFRDCYGLTSVTIPNSITSIGQSTFYDCLNLTGITIPNSVTSIGQEAFRFCKSLTDVTIPNSVETIGLYAFGNCSSLTTITVQPTTPPTLGENAIPSNVTTIYVPASSVNAYKSANGWSSYASKIQAIP